MNYLDINTCFGSLPDRPFDVDAARLVQLLERESITRAVSVSLTGVVLGPEEGNPHTLRAFEEFPQLLPAATVDPRSYFGKGDLVLHAREQGFLLLRLFNALQNWPLDFSPVEVVFQEAHEARLPVMVDARFYGDVTRAAQLAAVTETPVIVAGVGPDKLSELIVSMTEFPDLFVESSLLVSPDALSVLCEEVGHERILFGSGAALANPGAARLALERSNLSDHEILSIASLNALRLLSIS